MHCEICLGCVLTQCSVIADSCFAGIADWAAKGGAADAATPFMVSTAESLLSGRMLFVIDVLEGRVLDADAAVSAESGWSIEQLVDCTWADFIHPDDRCGVQQAASRVLQHKHCRWSCRLRHSDGQFFHYQCDATLGSKGAIAYIWASATEKQADQRADHWQYQRLVDLADELFVVADQRGMVVSMNAAAERTHGIVQSDWIGKPLADFVPPEGRPILDSIAQRFRDGEQSLRFTVPAYNSVGEIITLEGFSIWDPDTRRWFMLERDITKRVQRERDLEISQLFFERSPGQSALLDNAGRIMRANPAMLQFLECEMDQVTGQGIEQLLGLADSALMSDVLQRVIESGETIDLDLQTTVAGRERTLRMALIASSNRQSVFFTSRDITEELRLNSELVDRATRDQLTRLANREVFNLTLDDMLVNGQCVAVMVLDLDNFKHVNDSLGHEAGDELLLLVAQRLRETLRGDDLVARFGGDEFVILLGGTRARRDAVQVAEKVRQVLAEPHRVAGREVSATTSLGVAIGSADTHSASQLFREADAAAYKAKHLGRNRIQLFDSELREATQLQQSTELRLRSALRADAFDIDVQAIYTHKGDFWGIEALARLTHEDGTRSGPETFLGIARQLGLMSSLGEVIFNKSMRLLQPWLASHPAATLSLNTSAAEVGAPGFFRMVTDAIERHQIRPNQLMLEVNESSLLTPGSAAEQALDNIRGCGVGIAISNFGSGSSALSHLRDQKIDQIKIDGSFIRCLEQDRIANRITASIINLARELDIDVVAEGIETRAQMEILRDLGCPLLQGFLFHRHTVIDEFLSNADTLSGPLFALKNSARQEWLRAG